MENANLFIKVEKQSGNQKLKYHSSVAPVLDNWIYEDSPYNCSSPHGITQLSEF